VALLLELADASLEHVDTTNLAASAEDQTEERRASSPTCDSAATMKPSWSESSLGLADQSCQSFYSALDTTPDPAEADSPASPVTVRKARLRAADLDTAAVELSPVSLAAGIDSTETSPPQPKKESPGILQEKTVHPQAEVPQVQPISVSTAERRKPEISPKPVPAPRHFFLARPGEEEEGSAPVREGTVKDRARSFSCLPSYQVGPKPFRPSSIQQELQTAKPVHLAPKPKLAERPVPAPRQFRTNPTEPVTPPHQLTLKPLPSQFQKEVSPAEAVEIDVSNLEEVQVKRLASRFQQKPAVVPEKPVRKLSSQTSRAATESPPAPAPAAATPATPASVAAQNVMNIVTKLNALSTTV